MSELYTCRESVLGLRARSQVWGSGEFNKNWGEVKLLGQERQPPAQEDTPQSTDLAGPPLLLPRSPTPGTWSHWLLPGSWLRALARSMGVKVSPPPLPHSPSSPPTLPTALPFLGWALCSETHKEGEEGRDLRELGKEARAGGAHLGQTLGETGTGLVCGGLRPGPAHSLPPERAGSLLPRPLGRKETKAHPRACEGHTTQSGCGEKGTWESLGGGGTRQVQGT